MCILNQWLPSSKLRLWLVVAVQLKFKKHKEFSTIMFFFFCLHLIAVLKIEKIFKLPKTPVGKCGQYLGI